MSRRDDVMRLDLEEDGVWDGGASGSSFKPVVFFASLAAHSLQR